MFLYQDRIQVITRCPHKGRIAGGVAGGPGEAHLIIGGKAMSRNSWSVPAALAVGLTLLAATIVNAQPIGACCYGPTMEQCEPTEQVICETQYGGVWRGPGTDCTDLNGNGVADICEGLGGFKWVQPPDTSPLGIDVMATEPLILADDFLCDRRSLITRIRIWASWKNDQIPGDPRNVRFTLSFHSDIPAGPNGEFSRPGDVLWIYNAPPFSYQANLVHQGPEGWWDPRNPFGYLFPGDQMIWEYIFDIPTAQAFCQQGSPNAPIVYWLDVQAKPMGGPSTAQFGWKTSPQHWNDDAVWGQGPEPYPGPWNELRYPMGHEMMGQSIDLAFALEGDEPCEELDWGDAPDQPYPTLAASNGANHRIVPGMFLGNLIDAEPDGQPVPAWSGDDTNNQPDEDGVAPLTPLIPGMNAQVQVTASMPGMLDAWIDFNNNGSWADPGEQIFAAMPLAPGANVLTFPVPLAALPGPAGSRWRYSTAGGLPFTGPAPDGEVEDHLLHIGQMLADWGDAPDPPYPTLAGSNGAFHLPGNPQLFLGAGVDLEPNGQPMGPPFQGDDVNIMFPGIPFPPGDEDGVVFLTPFFAGRAARVQVTASMPGLLDAWIDFNNNGLWGDMPGEQIAAAMPLGPGPNILVVPVPALVPPTPFNAGARFRFSTAGGLPPVGGAPDGEVEDYEVMIVRTRIVGRHVFYNNSYYDGNKIAIDPVPIPGPNNDDDDAIDTSKTALLPGMGTATTANYVGYVKGVNGLMIDVQNAAVPPAPGDFTFFDIGRNGTAVPVAVLPTGFLARPLPGGGPNDYRCVFTFTWPINKKAVWLECQVSTAFGLPPLPSGPANLGDIFWYGHAYGEGLSPSGTNAIVDGTDVAQTKVNTHTPGNRALVWDEYDFNKNSLVDGTDVSISKNNGTNPGNCLVLITR